MIELPPLPRFEKDFHRMRESIDGSWCHFRAAEARERILLARIAELEADAERYRWLRLRNEGTEVNPSGPYVVNDDPGADVYPKSAQLDAAIDAARKA